MLGDTPGPPPLPFIGNLLELFALRGDDFWLRMLALVDKYAPTFRFWCGPECFVVMTHPADFEFVLNNAKFNDKSPWYPMARTALGTGLIILSGEQWKRHRKAVAPSMHQQVLVQNVQVSKSDPQRNSAESKTHSVFRVTRSKAVKQLTLTRSPRAVGTLFHGGGCPGACRMPRPRWTRPTTLRESRLCKS